MEVTGEVSRSLGQNTIADQFPFLVSNPIRYAPFHVAQVSPLRDPVSFSSRLTVLHFAALSIEISSLRTFSSTSKETFELETSD